MKMYVEMVADGICMLIIDFSIDGKILDIPLSKLLTRKEIRRKLTRKHFNILKSSQAEIIIKSLKYNTMIVENIDFPSTINSINFDNCDIDTLSYNSQHGIMFYNSIINTVKIKKPLDFIILYYSRLNTLISLNSLNNLLIGRKGFNKKSTSVISHMDIPYIKNLEVVDDSTIIGSFYGYIHNGESQYIKKYSMNMGKYHINGCYRDVKSLSNDVVLYINKVTI